MEPKKRRGETAQVQELLDRSSIKDIIVQYFYGVDRRDYVALASCFTSDACWEATLNNVVVRKAIGPKNIVAGMQSGGFAARCHMPGSQSIKISGDTATADTFAIAHLVSDPPEGGRIFVRGIHYLDDFVRTTEGWRIQHRRHFALWQYEAQRVPAVYTAAKANAKTA